MHFGQESRAITMLFLNEIIPLAIPYHSSYTNVYAMHLQNFIEICLLILKILSKNAFWTWIKGHNYVVSEWNYPTYNPIPLLSNTNVYAKFEENR